MKIVCLGDSITYGSTLKDLSQRWTDLVANEPHIEVINRGIGGDSTTGMLARLHTEVFPQKPDAIVFLGGVNDINIIGNYRIPCSNLTSIIVHANYYKVPLLVGLPLPIEPKDMPVRAWDTDRDYERTRWLIQKYAHFISHFCEGRQNLRVIDFRSPFLHDDGSVRRELFNDGIHPNAQGHRIMADAVCEALRDMFSL